MTRQAVWTAAETVAAASAAMLKTRCESLDHHCRQSLTVESSCLSWLALSLKIVTVVTLQQHNRILNTVFAGKS